MSFVSNNDTKIQKKEFIPLNSLVTKEMRSDEIVVGDIIKVMDDEIVPADCFVLTSGNAETNKDNNG